MDSPSSSLFIPFTVQSSKGSGKFDIDINITNGILNVREQKHYFSAGNTQWKIVIGPNSNCDFILVQIDCEEPSKSVLWNIEAVHKFSFTSDFPGSTLKKIEKTCDHSCTLSNRNHSFRLTKEEIDLLMPEDWEKMGGEKKFTLQMSVETEIRKKEGMRFRTAFSYDFMTQNDLSTLLLIIEEKRVFVNLDYLAQFSWYFLNLRKDESLKIDKPTGLRCLVLGDVKLESFILLLMMIYPTETGLTGETIEGILKVADYLLFETILIKCESFLISDHPGALNIGVYKKLQWSFDYRMSALQDHCWEQLISSRSIANLRNDAYYSELTDEVKVFLFDRIMALVNSGK